ncbi:MAG: sensor domain-containing diguanylate cyclase [Gemmatimonadaceae bacterium]|nr:sensor domain-containing diguanylate cyclase [Gemmatimonadaceae bacterium]
MDYGRTVEEQRSEITRLQSALRELEAQLQQVKEDAEARKQAVGILNDVMGNLPTEEIFHMLARRLARALDLTHSSVIIARSGESTGVVATAFEQPHLHDLKIDLAKYPEVTAALYKESPVLIPDILTSGRYKTLREEWNRDGTQVSVRSIISVPFTLDDSRTGVFLLRRTSERPIFTEADVEFAVTVIRGAVSAIQKVHTLEAARADNARLEMLAHTDPLTHLLNRRGLHVRLASELDRVRRYNAPLGLLLIDLDHFKSVNDTYGHLAGDDVLTEMGNLLQNATRSVDIVGRYGGEEFVVVLPETGVEGVMVFAQRIRDKIAAHKFSFGKGITNHLTASVGVANFPSVGNHSPEELLHAADMALYKAKESGRNAVCV